MDKREGDRDKPLGSDIGALLLFPSTSTTSETSTLARDQGRILSADGHEIQVYDMRRLLGDEAASALRQGTAFEGAERVGVKRGGSDALSTTRVHRNLHRLRLYMGELYQ